MEPFLAENYGNPSSIYRLAQQARSALDSARDTVAGCLGAKPGEIVFTSGGTESNNAAIKGAAFARREAGRHIVTTQIEHHAVLHPIEELTERFGFESTPVPAGSDGIVDAADIERAIRDDTILVSVMWANNEIGTIQPVERMARIAHERGLAFHVDAVQAAGSLDIDLSSTPIDLLSISAHKFYGPKGVGALFVRSGTLWWPLLTGGGQERNRRAGTENVAGIVGTAKALELAASERKETNARVRGLRDSLLHEIMTRIPDTVVNGDLDFRLAGNINVSFKGVHGESVLVALDLAGIMASSGSACTSGSLEPSHVLLGLGLPDSLAQGSLRLTVGKENTRAEVSRTVDVLEGIVSRLRSLAPAPAI
jgi:cysteine desulfurase